MRYFMHTRDQPQYGPNIIITGTRNGTRHSHPQSSGGPYMEEQKGTEIGAMLSNSPGALADYLDALVMASTYETDFVPTSQPLGRSSWRSPFSPSATQTKRSTNTGQCVGLTVSCQARELGYFEDPEPVRRKARTQWFPTTAISPHLEEWLGCTHGDMHAIDALVGFLQTRPLAEQVGSGLEWIHKIVIDDDRTAAACGFCLSAGYVQYGTSLVEEAPGAGIVKLSMLWFSAGTSAHANFRPLMSNSVSPTSIYASP